MNDDDPRTLQLLFEDRVRRMPDSIALDFEGDRVSYGELNRRANQLAHHLRGTGGVRPGDRVAILARHPLRVVVAILAAVKAGGAYVPLDPASPPKVTQQIVEDVAPRAMVIESSVAAGAMFFDGELVVLDVVANTLSTPDTDPAPLAGHADLAYVIYTSGTTGKPKGIAVEHRAIVNTVTWRNAYYGFGPQDVALAISQPSFDSSVADTFCALTAGARLVLPRRDRITDRRYLAGLVTDRGVTHFLVTPALYTRILGGIDARSATSLRGVTIAGEQFTSSLTQEHFRRLPDVKLFNEYGPSENAVCSTVHPLAASDTSVLIGRPIDRVEAFVLAGDGTRVQPGETGELHLGGAGLARGYLGNPELTAEKFFTLPTPAGNGQRVYRTGDIVRLCADGNLQFVGRGDAQVKIRGRRVELGHVAEILAGDGVVDHVHLLCHDTDSAVSGLIAFVQGPADDDIGRLDALARENLPEYMVPTAIIPIDALPLTGNGKVDEATLTELYTATVGRGGPDSRSATPTEAALLEVWQGIFAPLRVGLDDDFFDLGGDSLSVMDLTAGVEERLGFPLENSAVYADRTIRSLARSIDSRRTDKAGLL